MFEVATALHMFFWLLVGHALCDMPLQGGFLSQAKRKNGVPDFPWWLALTWHGLIHGGSVALVTGDIRLGIAETFLHALIDNLKCRNKIGIVMDQSLHVLCKIAWVAIVFWY